MRPFRIRGARSGGADRGRWATLVAPVVIALCAVACKADRSSDGTNGSAASSPAPGAATTRSPESLDPPPLAPPGDARPIAGGGRWRLLHGGTGPGPRPDQQVLAEVSVWGSDGKLVESSKTIERGTSFQMRMLPEALHPVLGQLGPGAAAVLWLPGRQVAGFRPPSWPSGKVIIEIEVLAVDDDPEPAAEQFGAREHLPRRVAERAADIGSPPSTAKRTSTGLRYVTRREGTGARPAGPRAKLVTYVSAYALRLEAESILDHQQMTFIPEEAPGGLGEALMTLGVGGLLQIWVPADKAGTVLPGRDGTELVLDVYLQALE